MKSYVLVIIAFALSTSVAIAQSVVKPTGNAPRFPKAYKQLANQSKPPSGRWLLDANDDTERFRRIQIVAGGSDMQMMAIAHRYEELHGAIQKNNWEMGVYHWEKLRDYMNIMAMKRPVRTQNLEDLFLYSGVWQSMHDALMSRDARKMRAQFQSVRQACMACHVAENVGFMNDSSVFARTASFPDTRN
jgi:hypothetical protein